MEINNTEIIELAKIKIAEEVVNQLDDNTIKAILSDSIAKTFGDWSFQESIKKAVREEGLKHVLTYLKEPNVQEEIKNKSIETSKSFISIFQKVMFSTLLSLFDEDKHGEYYKPKIYKRLRDEFGIPAGKDK